MNALTDTVVLARRGITLTLRSPVTLVLTAFFPVILLVLLSVSFADVVMPGAGYAAYVNYSVPLFAAMGVTFATLSTADAVHADRISGFDDRIRTLPVAPVAPLAGRILADTVRNLSTVVVVTAVGTALGFRLSGGLVGAVLYVGLPLIYGFGLSWVMIAVALRASSAETATSMLNALMLVLSFLSTGFVRLGDLPGWVQPIARVNPVSHLVEAMRSGAGPGDLAAGNVGWTLVWTIALTAGFGFLSVRDYARRR